MHKLSIFDIDGSLAVASPREDWGNESEKEAWAPIVDLALEAAREGRVFILTAREQLLYHDATQEWLDRLNITGGLIMRPPGVSDHEVPRFKLTHILRLIRGYKPQELRFYEDNMDVLNLIVQARRTTEAAALSCVRVFRCYNGMIQELDSGFKDFSHGVNADDF